MPSTKRKAARSTSTSNRWASRAILRQTDETLSQAVANWRPRITLNVEYNKVEQDSYSQRTAPTFYALNGKFTTLQAVQPLFRGGKTIAETKQAQSNIQAQRAQLAETEQNVLLSAVTSYADLVQNLGIADARRNNVRVLVQQLAIQTCALIVRGLDAAKVVHPAGQVRLRITHQNDEHVEFFPAQQFGGAQPSMATTRGAG